MAVPDGKLDELKAKGTYLSCDAMFLLVYCIDRELERLEKLHWATLPYLPTGQYEALQKMRAECNTLEATKKLVERIYAAQFGEI